MTLNFLIIISIIDVAECLLSNDNVDYASKAAEKYQDSRSINDSFKSIRQSRDSKYT